MLIDEEKLIYWIDHFFGYGSWDARFWFINYEESGGDLPEDVADRLNYLHKNKSLITNDSLCDLRELYDSVKIRIDGPKANLFSSRYDYRFGVNAVQHNVWKNLIAFECGFDDKRLPDSLKYQKQKFGLTSSKNEALISLYPLPSPHNHAWYYSWLDFKNVKFIKSRKLYENHVYEQRINTILTNIANYKPEIVLMYGMNNISSLKKSILGFYPDVKFSQVKMIKLQIPQHHWAMINDTIVLITTQIPTLRHGRIETGFNWELLGNEVRAYKKQI